MIPVLALFVLVYSRGGWQFATNGLSFDLEAPVYQDIVVDEASVLYALQSSNYVACGLYIGTAFTNMLITLMIGKF
jgi:hypothetical protein